MRMDAALRPLLGRQAVSCKSGSGLHQKTTSRRIHASVLNGQALFLGAQRSAEGLPLLRRIRNIRQGEKEGRAFAGRGIYPDPASMPIDNPLAQRQSDTRAWRF